MSGVFRKEMGQYFRSLAGYVFIAMFLALSGVLFLTVNLLPQNGDIKAFYGVTTILCMLLLPILTMRLFADERRQKTDELLLTAPVSLTAIVTGKFFAAFIVFLLSLCLTLMYPLVLYCFGVSALWVTMGNFLGMALLGAALIAIGLFLSMQTESQFVAAVLTYGFFALLFLAGSAGGFAGAAALGGLLHFLAIAEHFQGLSYGVFPLVELVYYLSITALFLFLGVHTLERRRLA